MSEFPNQEESIFPDIEGRPKTNSNTYINITNSNKNNKTNKRTNSYTNKSIDSNKIYTSVAKTRKKASVATREKPAGLCSSQRH